MFHLLWKKQCSRFIFMKDYSLRQNFQSELKRPKIKELYLEGLKPVLVFKKTILQKGINDSLASKVTFWTLQQDFVD